MSDACRCTTEEQAKACRRASVRMSGHMWTLCKTRDDLRRHWDRLGLERVPDEPRPDGKRRLAACAHRRRAVRGELRAVG